MLYVILGDIWRTFKETPTFMAQVESHGGVELLKAIQDAILKNPQVGSLLIGGGGLRKFRIADRGRRMGKRSGFRVIFLDLPDREVTHLVFLYSKDESDDLTSSDKAALKDLVDILKREKK